MQGNKCNLMLIYGDGGNTRNLARSPLPEEETLGRENKTCFPSAPHTWSCCSQTPKNKTHMLTEKWSVYPHLTNQCGPPLTVGVAFPSEFKVVPVIWCLPKWASHSCLPPPQKNYQPHHRHRMNTICTMYCQIDALYLKEPDIYMIQHCNSSRNLKEQFTQNTNFTHLLLAFFMSALVTFSSPCDRSGD